MKTRLVRDLALRFVATNESGIETVFDTSKRGGGLNTAAGPMDHVLGAAAGCTAMDVVSMMEKRRRTLDSFAIALTATRADEHPKVFTSIEMAFEIESSDATMKEVVDSIRLSHEKYCSVTIMLIRSGCAVSWSVTLRNPMSGATQQADGTSH